MMDAGNGGYCFFGAKVLLARLQNVAKEIPGVREAEDIDCIHDMRVATRRMRSALPLFEDCLPGKSAKKWNKQMRRVTRALGTARDADVQIDFLQDFLESLTESRYRPGVQRLLLRLQQRREGAQEKVESAMDKLEKSDVLEDIGKTLRQIQVSARMNHEDEKSNHVYKQAYLAISIRLEDALAYEIYVDHPKRVEELHALRIAAKRLRYTMEVFESLYDGELKPFIKTVKKIQTLLGDMHDCDVWVTNLPEFLEEERERTLEYYGHTRPMGRLEKGILYLQKERQGRRDELYKEFIEFWYDIQGQNFWDNLLELISRPLPGGPVTSNLDLSDQEAG